MNEYKAGTYHNIFKEYGYYEDDIEKKLEYIIKLYLWKVGGVKE